MSVVTGGTMVTNSAGTTSAVFAPIDPRLGARATTRLVSAHLCVHARIQTSVMRAGPTGSGRSILVIDGIGVLNALSAQVISRTEARARGSAPLVGRADAVLIESARTLGLRSVRIPYDSRVDPWVVLCWLDHDFAPVGERAVMGQVSAAPLRHSFTVALPIEVRLWLTAHAERGGGAAILLGGEITLEKGILLRLGLSDRGGDDSGGLRRSDSEFMVVAPRVRVASLPSRTIRVLEGAELKISVRFLGDVGDPTGFEYVVGRYLQSGHRNRPE
jgi:hypothetical protein